MALASVSLARAVLHDEFGRNQMLSNNSLYLATNWRTDSIDVGVTHLVSTALALPRRMAER